MLVSHEIPKELFSLSKGFNDFPYVLGHLINLDFEYKEFYKKELREADFSILDNSAFELGKSIDFKELISVTRELNPSHLVLPDTVHNKEETIKNSLGFLSEYYLELCMLKVTPIGVVQGNSFEELHDCIKSYIVAGVSFIAIPFDCIKGTDYGTIRFQFFRYLLDNLGEMTMMQLKFHFLGLQNPQEMLLYSDFEKSFIHSIDSSSPILHGVIGNRFTKWGTNKVKPTLKLADNLNLKVTGEMLNNIGHNVQHFKNYIK